MAQEYAKVNALICKETKQLVAQPLMNTKTGEIFDAGCSYIKHMNPRLLKENYVEIKTLRVASVRNCQFSLRSESLNEMLNNFDELNFAISTQQQVNDALTKDIEAEKQALVTLVAHMKFLEEEIDQLQDCIDLVPAKGVVDETLLGKIQKSRNNSAINSVAYN